jgi:hypothetical protein
LPSTFSWLDTSEHDRRRVLDAIDVFKDSEAREELGLGTIRDAFADDLFPGTSTIQTRAGYFLFVPWLYRSLHERGATATDVAAKMHRAETQVIDALLASSDTEGVIGKRAKSSLKRMPSLIYWNGLAEWGIRQFPGSVDDYHRSFERFRLSSAGDRDDDRQPLNDRHSTDWHSGLPPAPAGFPKVTEFKLRPADASYLAERIRLSHPDSLLAWLTRHADTLESDTPWEHPQADAFPTRIRHTLEHARCFAETARGAALLYNLMLAERKRLDELAETYRDALKEWAASLVPRRATLRAWNRDDLWGMAILATTTPGTKSFVNQWLDMSLWEDGDLLIGSSSARALIARRELQLKGPRARLVNARALELWGGDSGTALLVYRWPSAVRILRDLRPDLGGTNASS